MRALIVACATTITAAGAAWAGGPADRGRPEERTMDSRDDREQGVRILDQVDPFWNDDAGVIFDDDAMAALQRLPTMEGTLVGVALDGGETLHRRFAALEALFQAERTSFLDDPKVAPTMAKVFASALEADRLHNRWGLPGHHVGRTGKYLLSLRHGVTDALTALLDDDDPLTIVGSEAATLNEQHRYRVCDLALYLLARYRSQLWIDDPDPKVRDAKNEHLRR